MSLVVNYKGTQIAELTQDGSLTLNTAGKYCEGNILLSASDDVSSVTATYDGNTIISGQGTNDYILNCAGKIMKTNVGISASMSPAPTANPYLTFETEDGSEFTINAAQELGSYGKSWDGTMEYSTDTVNWQTWQPTSTISSVDGKLYVRGTGNTMVCIYWVNICFLPGTKITLADGSVKNVEDITYNDKIKVWNFDSGDYDEADICFLTKLGLTNNHYYRLTFSDGTELCTTGIKSNHKVYAPDKRRFENVSTIAIGEKVFTEHGIVTVTDKEYIEADVYYYNLITSYHFDCFANGILTSNRLNNLMYPINNEMKYVDDGRVIRPYSEFEAVGISRYWYDNLRLGENSDSIEGNKEYIDKIEPLMRERG